MSAERFWTDTRIIEAVLEFHRREGKWPKEKDFVRTEGLPSATVVRLNMGTWQEPVRRAQAHIAQGEAAC